MVVYILVSELDYEDATMTKENWTIAEELAMDKAEQEAKRYELEALREALEFAPQHERRWLLEKIKELESAQTK